MTFLKLGFRSLFRQKRRTAITLLVITFGIGCLLLAEGHSLYINWGLRESTIHSETGHLQIFKKEYFEKEEETLLQYGLDDYENLSKDLMQFEDVKLGLARIDLMGLISNGDKSLACVGQAVEPKKEKELRQLFNMKTSIYDSLILYENEVEIIALGNGLAKSLNAKPGDYLTLMATTTDGALNALDLKLVGTFSGFSPEYADRVKVYDFSSDAAGEAVPHGIYDMTQNVGWVSVGTNHDTAEFAVETIRKWWYKMGTLVYNNAKQLLITANCGGSNGSRVRLWKKEIQDFANESGLEISICHYPPGTSKWNKIEHRLFSSITQNWRGKPLITYEVIVNLIGGTKTTKGLEEILCCKSTRCFANLKVIGINDQLVLT